MSTFLLEDAHPPKVRRARVFAAVLSLCACGSPVHFQMGSPPPAVPSGHLRVCAKRPIDDDISGMHSNRPPVPPPKRVTKIAHTEDLALVRRAIAREPEARESFIRRASCIPGFLRNRASRLGMRVPSSALEDLTQETYLALWAKLASYRGESRLETWVCGFAFIQLRRWQAARHRNRHESFDRIEEPGVEAQLPNETAEVVKAILESLGSPAVDVVKLKHFEGLTFALIATRLDMSSNSAKSYYYRCLSRLRESLDEKISE